MVRFPGLIELADHSIRECDECLRQEMIAELENFIKDFDHFATQTWPTAPYTDSLSDPDHFVSRLFPESSLGRPYSFTTWRTTSTYCTMSTVRLYSLLELQRLQRHNFRTLNSEPMATDAFRMLQVEADIEHTIENVCRALPAQIGAPSHSMGIICSLKTLSVLARLLEKRGRFEEAGWCRSVWQHLRDDGFR